MNTLSTARWPRLPVLSRPFPSLLDDVFNGFEAPARAAGFTPAMDIWSDAEALHIVAELPGLTIDDIELTVLGDTLTLKGSRAAPALEDVALHLTERRHGGFERRLRLPFEVQGDAVKAQLKQGVLHVVLPKAEAEKPRRIQVDVSAD